MRSELLDDSFSRLSVLERRPLERLLERGMDRSGSRFNLVIDYKQNNRLCFSSSYGPFSLHCGRHTDARCQEMAAIPSRRVSTRVGYEL